MPSIEILQPRLSGERFRDGAIPLEVLADLAALGEMILDVAKWRFLETNPRRQRTPPGFFHKIDLKLTRIGGGSAVPTISLTTTHPLILEIYDSPQVFVEEAIEYILSAIGSAGRNGSNSEVSNVQLPNRFLKHFNRVGYSLRDDEFWEFQVKGSSDSARLTKETRHRLLELWRELKHTQDVALRGGVSEVDRDRMTFELAPVYGPKTKGPIPEEHLHTIIDALSGYRTGRRVLVKGIGRYDNQGRLIVLESVESAALLDPLDVPACLDEFRSIKPGWLEGRGLAPSHSGLGWLAEVFERYYSSGLPLPHTYPTPEGGVRMEWSHGANAMILEIDLNTRIGEWLWFDRNSDAEIERALNLDNPTDWAWLVSEILDKTLFAA